MNADQFREVVARARADHPVWFELESDPPASEQELSRVEAGLGLTLPLDYAAFLREYGGGYFAMATVYSAREGSPFDVLQNNLELGFLARGFIAISDNETGDYYGYRVINGEPQGGIVFADHELDFQLLSTSFADVFEFLAHQALQSN